MSSLILSTVGAAVGSVFGPIGTIVGRAIGGLAGAALDQALFAPGRDRSVGRLADLEVQASTEGVAVPRVFGRVRIAGQVIWATRLEETSQTERTGGKGGGGPKVTTFSYYANMAVGLCEGPIARVGRVWANGEPLDLSGIQMRVHRGTEDQGVDTLIEAKQGTGNAPAYRGLAYVVFERLPLEAFGNALPQLTFEVIRPVGRLEPMIRAVTLIPGATEFGYATGEVQQQLEPGRVLAENRHILTASSDVMASLDELTAVCPNLERVAVVVAWFGSDLRAGHCTLAPKVEWAEKTTTGATWEVAGLARGDAAVVSRVDGLPAFGGTPSDASVLALIAELKARGLKVTLYPFVLMDVANANALPDPYTGLPGQPVYPWRGRITVDPAPGRPGSPDGTAAATAQVNAFVGTASPAQFSASGRAVVYGGPAEWSFRRMVLHYARLCAIAGGVDTFLIGSELRGLTWTRGGAGQGYPFVTALKALAADVKGMLGPGTEVSYAADWTEWFGHQPADGSGDVAFHLDPLWSDPNIDFVGIDAYPPLTDWRDGDHLDATAAEGPADREYLAAGVAGGEGFDWYYASDLDRRAQVRTPITDGAAGKPWVFRFKDLAGWWGNRHYDRVAGVELPTPTGWIAGMKPLRFTELGCPAVDVGGNEPNVFPDRISSEGRAPRFSHASRDDAVQRRWVEAMLNHFDPAAPGFTGANNPLSPVDGRRMLDPTASHVWTWDARPFPAFPLARQVWADARNWVSGHWLNGRLGNAPLDDTVADMLGADVDVDSDGLTPVVDGLVLAGRAPPRSVLEPLAGVFRFQVTERGATLVFRDRPSRIGAVVESDDLAEEDGEPVLEIRRGHDGEAPTEIAVSFSDTANEFRQTNVSARRTGRQRTSDVTLPVTAAAEVMQGHVEAVLRDGEAGRETVRFALPPQRLDVEAGDVLRLAAGARSLDVLVERSEDGPLRRLEARVVDRSIRARAAVPDDRIGGFAPPPPVGPPLAVFLDLPALGDAVEPHRPWLAAAGVPWPGQLTVHKAVAASFEPVATIAAPAAIGTLQAALGPGPVWRFDRGATVEVALVRGALFSATEEAVLEGANVAAIGSEAARFEIVQFLTAELIGERRYRLRGLLRGQLGTEALAAVGAPVGSRFVLVDRNIVPLPLNREAIGRPLTLRIGKAGRDVGDAAMTELNATPRGVGLRPWSPVRLTAQRIGPSGDLAVTWIRRTRTGGDNWEAVEVPLSETVEAYELRVRVAGSVVRRIAATGQGATYAAADQIADHGLLPGAVDLAVAQLSETLGPGPETRKVIDV
ncbi:baseplate multidomain protein megatron [Chthonobacter albigriseus]|uniref:baseplate multidomain protein megatron n=1 Tax=Chthonobacter albigriseus TaxID=1683161 RepID=UPI0015EE64A9|nr:glycoside hydrolase/phage tail family protein [Chthonobacter albigriseus]